MESADDKEEEKDEYYEVEGKEAGGDAIGQYSLRLSAARIRIARILVSSQQSFIKVGLDF